MPKSKKEDNASHYRSGIFDVHNIPVPSDDRPRQNVIVRDGLSDLRDILTRLDKNVEENTRAIKSLGKYLAGKEKNTSLRTRSDKVVVEVQVSFLRITDVDTKTQTFSADIFLQGAWQEPALAKATQTELDELDWENMWVPKLIITNTEGRASEVKHWNSAARGLAGYRYPVLYTRWRMRAKFKENLELQQFPVDTQELSLVVSTERTEAEVTLVEDRTSLSVISTDTFQDGGEFRLYRHLEVAPSTGNTGALDHLARSPKITFTCHVMRRLGFFIMNVVTLLFLLTVLLFTGYSISPDDPGVRLKVTITLLLTVVAYKITLSKDLPTLPYPTYLDTYMVINIVFLAIQAALCAILGVVARDRGLPVAMEADKYCFAVLLFTFLTISILCFGFLTIKYIKQRRRMQYKEAEFMKRKREYQERIYDAPPDDFERRSRKKHKSSRTVEVHPSGKEMNIYETMPRNPETDS